MEQENRVRMERIAADPQSGLSAEQVKRRFAQGENNYKVESSTLSVPEIVRSNVCTYFNLVFAVIAVLLAIVGAWSDMLFLPIIVANTCIGIIQEVHSKKVLDKLSILNAPHAVVIRDGKRQEIPIAAGSNLLYAVPQMLDLAGDNSSTTVYFRSREDLNGCRFVITVDGREVFSRRYPFLRPPEMEKLVIDFSSYGLTTQSQVKLDIEVKADA